MTHIGSVTSLGATVPLSILRLEGLLLFYKVTLEQRREGSESQPCGYVFQAWKIARASAPREVGGIRVACSRSNKATWLQTERTPQRGRRWNRRVKIQADYEIQAFLGHCTDFGCLCLVIEEAIGRFWAEKWLDLNMWTKCLRNNLGLITKNHPFMHWCNLLLRRLSAESVG